MKDQAEQLRLQINRKTEKKFSKTLAVISGKGGVGKSNFSLNFSILLSKLGNRVLLFDMDIGMGNIDILMGDTAKRTIVDFFQNGKSLQEVIVKGPENLSFISGGTGLTHLFSMNEQQFLRFTEQFSEMQSHYDYVVFDFGAGISEASTKFLNCVDEIITITTPEPPSIMDAYSIIKYLHIQNQHLLIYLVCNRTLKERQGTETLSRLQLTLRKFLNKDAVILGSLPDSKHVLKAVANQTPFTVLNPNADVSVAMKSLTLHYLSNSNTEEHHRIKQSFVSKLKKIFGGR